MAPFLKILAKRKDILLGAGTVLNKKQVVEVVEIGAKFIPTGGINEINLSSYIYYHSTFAIGGVGCLMQNFLVKTK